MQNRYFYAPLFLLAVLLTAALCPAAANDQELLIIDAGHSEYQIVFPERSDALLENFHRNTAKLIQDCLKQTYGAELPVVQENQRDSDRPGIYLGACKAAIAAGLIREKYGLWEHDIVVRGRDVFLLGEDRRASKTENWYNHYHYWILGSIKASLVFLREFAGAEFLFPGPEGLVYGQKSPRLAVPAAYHWHRKPELVYNIGPRQGMFYDLANGLLPAPWYGTYGGHSHSKAVTRKLFGESHPEYFALLNGTRENPSRNHDQFCLSNPEVQELIYGDMLTRADAGYQMVQLAQSDGFQGCECAPCQEWFQTSAWSEKLWLLHRNLAERFERERPGKQVCIIAYGPTRTPPASFRDFPANVVIELAPYNDEVFQQWKDYRVPGGFVVYLYNWGWYQTEGATPKCTFAALAQQARNFQRDRIIGVYRCGNECLPGLEGPALYLWQRLCEDPGLQEQEVLQHYYQKAFGKAAPQMAKFYQLLDQRLELKLSTQSNHRDWNDPELLSGKRTGYENFQLLSLRFPDPVLAELEAQLSAAEAAGTDGNPAIQRSIRQEFDYLQLTCGTINAYLQLLESGTSEDSGRLVDLMVRRTDFIQALPGQEKKPDLILGPSFAGMERAVLQDNGRLSAPFRAPLCWDAHWLRDKQVKILARELRPAPPGQPSPEPQYLVCEYVTRPGEYITARPVSITSRCDEQNLYISYRCENVAPELRKHQHIYLRLAPEGDLRRMIYIHTAPVSSAKVAFSTLSKTSEENDHNGHVFVRKSDAWASCQAPAPDLPPRNEQEVSAQIIIPFAVLGCPAPAAGARWQFNASYCLVEFSDGKVTGYQKYIWEFNPRPRSWRTYGDAMGTIIFP